ncbi:unnamed protein product [Brassica napus]|uniref:(rape) hypothetical protein n=1 Tax=Brassica napus TaxID=3708 RepID=A0A817AZ04_BRANA|nr:unnamed protein product [Brassica napus]
MWPVTGVELSRKVLLASTSAYPAFLIRCEQQPGYSSPAQAAIRNDLFLTIAEFSLFGSLLTFGAMIGAITSGPIPDLVGRKGAGAKAYIFAGGATAEHLAADIGDLVLINCLLKLDEGNRPLEVAALRENKKIVETPPIDNKV